MDIYERIAASASQMQDLRDDAGHANIVTAFARRLHTLLKADERIVVPAAILHDIGYFGMDATQVRLLMTKELGKEAEDALKLDHMRRGAMLARRILDDVGYPTDLSRKIVDIINKHDSDLPCESTEERVVRDADKLWRFSAIGIATDMRRRGCTSEEWIAKLRENLAKRKYFHTDEARVIARLELRERVAEAKQAAAPSTPP